MAGVNPAATPPLARQPGHLTGSGGVANPRLIARLTHQRGPLPAVRPAVAVMQLVGGNVRELMTKDFTLKLWGRMLEAGMKPNAPRRRSAAAKRGAEASTKDHLDPIDQPRYFPEMTPADYFRL